MALNAVQPIAPAPPAPNASAAATSAEATPGPLAGPAATPEKPSGNALLAKIRVQTAMQVLKSALPLMDIGSKEGQALLGVLHRLVREFGGEAEAASLVPAQVLELVRSVQQQGAASLKPPGVTEPATGETQNGNQQAGA